MADNNNSFLPGTEFYNNQVKRFLDERSITLFSSENDDIKCSMAERLILTFKRRIWRLFRHQSHTKYIDKLADLTHSYNRSLHSAHGMKPVDVKQTNSLTVFNKLYGEMLKDKPKPARYQIGNHVRISKSKGKFEKSYEYRFHERIYVITAVLLHVVPMYEIQTLKGSKIAGKFYESELSLVRGNIYDKVYPVEKIIKERTRQGRRDCLVRYAGYESDDDEWIPKSKCMNKPLST